MATGWPGEGKSRRPGWWQGDPAARAPGPASTRESTAFGPAGSSLPPTAATLPGNFYFSEPRLPEDMTWPDPQMPRGRVRGKRRLMRGQEAGGRRPGLEAFPMQLELEARSGASQLRRPLRGDRRPIPLVGRKDTQPRTPGGSSWLSVPQLQGQGGPGCRDAVGGVPQHRLGE